MKPAPNRRASDGAAAIRLRRRPAVANNAAAGPAARLMIRVALGPDGSLGPGKVRLMELIDETGSIAAACRAMDMSYRRAWRLLRDLNAAFREEVVATRHGGNQGGGAELTPFGRALLARCEAIREKAHAAVRGELAALETDCLQGPAAMGGSGPGKSGGKA